MAACSGAYAQVNFTGTDYKVITEKPEASTGLNQIYVLYDTDGVTAKYKAKSTDVNWMRYRNLGGGHAEPVTPAVNDDEYSLPLGADDMGYIIEDGTDRYYFWIVNYANHKADFQALTFSPEQECDRARLVLTGNASKITYYTINGAAKELSRQLTIEYTTLKLDEATMSYSPLQTSQTFDYIDGSAGVFAPLCDTRFVLSGDRFLRAWGMEQSITTDTYQAIAVEARTNAEQETRDYENEQKDDAGALGGSAPVEVHFTAAVTDAGIFREWQMTRDQTFEQIDDRYQELDFDYTFRENGTTYVRFVTANADASCEYVGETYEIFIGESDLLCPNAFSPNGDGVNDEWRVSYKSIVEYECHIFNRWGQEMFSSTNPGAGWDGKYKGKTVPTGVYYYVIKAKGADGRRYDRNGDINIIHAQKGAATATPAE